jgi:hypothetical protein
MELKSMTLEEVMGLLYGNGTNIDMLGHNNFDHNGYELFSVESVEEVGGEGCGDAIWNVLKLITRSDPKDFVFVKISGNYSSWNGTDWDYGTQTIVRPVEVTRIEYQ